MTTKATEDSFTDLIRPLRDKEAHLLEILSGLREEVTTHEAILERVQTAIAALEAPSSNGKAKNTKKKKTPGKPAPSKPDVLKALREVRAETPDAPEAQQRAAVEAKILEGGFSRAGLALRFKEAIAQTATAVTTG